MIKYILKLLAMSAVLVMMTWLAWQLLTRWRPSILPPARLLSSAPKLAQIQTLSHLATLKVEVADAMVFQLNGKTGGIAAVVVIRGEAILGVNLKASQFLEVDESRHRLVLDLPQPAVLSVSVDHQRTKVVALQASGLWLLAPGGSVADVAVLESCFRQAEAIIREAANAPELQERARNQLQTVLNSFCDGANWHVAIQWRDG